MSKNNDMQTPGFREKDLMELASALGMSYEIDYDISTARSENRTYCVRANVKLKGLQSKRYAVFHIHTPYSYNDHTKRLNVELELLYRKPFDCKDALLPADKRRIRDEAASFAMSAILNGCVIKISKTRRVEIPPASSIEELKLKLAVKGMA